MAAEWVEFGKEVLKLAVRARYSFTIWVVSFIILVVPTPEFLRLDRFRQDYGQFLGVICLTAFVMWVVELTIMVSEIVKGYLAAQREEKKILKQLDSLNPSEVHLLTVAVSKKIQTVVWGQANPEVSSLVAKGLLTGVPDIRTMLGRPFTIPRFVWDEINKPKVFQNVKALDKTGMRP